MNYSFTEKKRIRKSFAKRENVLDVPFLLATQIDSYAKFLQLENAFDQRTDDGLQAAFNSIFPIVSHNGYARLEFVHYTLGEPLFDIPECQLRGITYAAPLRARIRLVILDKEASKPTVKEVRENEVYMGEIPLMTPSGSFVINGTERVIVSQLHRSPGVFFEHDRGKTHSSGKLLFSARIIPYRGSWLDFEFDPKDLLYFRIDRRRKMPVTILLKALGYNNEQILDIFYDKETFYLSENGVQTDLVVGRLKGETAKVDILDKEGNVLVAKGKRITAKNIRDISNAGLTRLDVEPESLIGKALAADLIGPETGEVLAVANDEITEELLAKFDIHGVKQLTTLYINELDQGGYISNTLRTDETADQQAARVAIYRMMRPGEPPTEEAVEQLFNRLFFSEDSYDLSRVGRMKFNTRTYEQKLSEVQQQSWYGRLLNETFAGAAEKGGYVLSVEDIVASIATLVELRNGHGEVDDIDHLGNRRVRSVGELTENQFRSGLARVERAVKERLNQAESENLMPHDLINAKPVSAAIKEFFGSSQLSQFMDQTNPLSEVTHKRRVSALGPGGLTRERAGFEVRDVHYTHYGRLCPIESPEGPNIGLISSLCVYANINELGFIETPYRKVTNGVVDLDNKNLVYLTAEEEEDHIIGQGNAPLNEDGTFIREVVKCRQDADFPVVEPTEVDLMDVSPQQIASVSAGLIPFLEHDDGHRALMGCNMMRQAVPLLHNDAPIVGTGLEKQVCEDSRTMITAEGDGVIDYVDATTIRILYDRTEDEEYVSFEPALKEYRVPKFRRTNQNMTIDLRPICVKGQRVKAGDILTEGYATENGELALGRNLLVAYMPWKGYNYEDAIVLSERLVRDDVLTSVHVDEYSLDVRETKRGVEEFTSDIPNVSEEATKDLDDNGVVRIGARIEPGDILIGKISPKGESDPSPEEKLLRAIFGDKAGDVKDSSLKANPSLSGVVIDKKLFSRAIKTRDSKKQDKVILAKIDEEYEAKNEDLKDILVDKLLELTEDKVSQGVKDYTGAEIINKGSKFTAAALKNLEYDGIQSNDWTDDAHTNDLIQKLIMNYIRKYKLLDAELKRRKFAITIGDELPSGILQMAKVYVAKKRKIGVGDKLAGRHGNKGIVSKVVRMEDMPFLEDGRPVDLVLNPLGVPSRMNLGQIFEAILGAAGKKLGLKFATPIFDGAHLEDLSEWTDKAELPRLCSTYLYDGETGEKFDQPATVGVTYFLKLGHMVEDKMHARSIGPYSLITQQPLGGKAQFGGQRFGEMEVWAIEAFGASHILQEILTIKSDDVVGRSKAYEAIVKGEPMPTPGIPESLNVLLHELRGLGLSIKMD